MTREFSSQYTSWERFGNLNRIKNVKLHPHQHHAIPRRTSGISSLHIRGSPPWNRKRAKKRSYGDPRLKFDRRRIKLEVPEEQDTGLKRYRGQKEKSPQTVGGGKTRQGEKEKPRQERRGERSARLGLFLKDPQIRTVKEPKEKERRRRKKIERKKMKGKEKRRWRNAGEVNVFERSGSSFPGRIPKFSRDRWFQNCYRPLPPTKKNERQNVTRTTPGAPLCLTIGTRCVLLGTVTPRKLAARNKKGALVALFVSSEVDQVSVCFRNRKSELGSHRRLHHVALQHLIGLRLHLRDWCDRLAAFRLPDQRFPLAAGWMPKRFGTAIVFSQTM